MNNSRRRLEIVLSGSAVVDGRVSVVLFTKTIQSVQETLIQLAKSRSQEDPAKKGPIPSSILRECELFLVKVKPGSGLHALMELPEKQPSLFPNIPDFAESALEDTKNSLIAIANQDSEKLRKVIPNPIYRHRVVNKVAKIAPGIDSDYHLEVRTQNEPPIVLVRPSKEAIIRLEALPPTQEKKLGPRRTLVDARGLAEIDKGNITKWIETYDMAELEFDFEHAWRPHEIKAKGKLFILAHPIACVIVEEHKELLVSEFEPLGILAYGENRAEVIRAFSHEFAILWDAIAQEPEAQLTEDARLLKKKLNEMVKEVKPYDPAKNKRPKSRTDQ